MLSKEKLDLNFVTNYQVSNPPDCTRNNANRCLGANFQLISMFFKALNDAEICSKSALGLYPSTGPSIQTGGTPKGWVCAITNTRHASPLLGKMLSNTWVLRAFPRLTWPLYAICLLGFDWTFPLNLYTDQKNTFCHIKAKLWIM